MAPAAILNAAEVSPPPPSTEPHVTNGKRSLSQISTAEDPSYSPYKRQKVSFSPHVDVHVVDDYGEKSVAVVREEIFIALRQHGFGDNERYEEVKAIFIARPGDEDVPSTSTIRTYLSGLIENVALLKQSCADLVHAVLETKWLAHDDALANLYTRFLGHLASSQRGYLSDILKMLVQNFAHISFSAGRSLTQTLPDRLRQQAHIHAALKYLIQLIPSSVSALATTLSSSFPFPTDTKKAHTEYVRNILRITEYAPELKAELLDLIAERMIKIDVEIQNNLEDMEEEIVDLLEQDHHSGLHQNEENKDLDISDNDSLSGSEDEDIDDEFGVPRATNRIETLRSSVEKMDALLDTLFTFYTPYFEKNSQSQTAHTMFNQLLSQFQKIVLPTYRSRHTQFVLFHFAQTSPTFTTSFIDKCLSVLSDKTRSVVIRASAAAYIASFVARGAKLKPDSVVYAFDRLAAYLETLRKTYEPQSRGGPDLRKFSTYYVTVQALVYIFCFRWRDLVASAHKNDEDSEDDSDDDIDGADEFIWAAGVKEVFAANFHSRLNPLKMLAPAIVEEFARIALHTRFMYVYAIIDANKRVRVHSNPSSGTTTPSGVGMPNRETALSATLGAFDGVRHLEAYFPFDPYRLPKSRRWLVGEYKEWQGVSDEAQAEAAGDSSDEADPDNDIDVLEEGHSLMDDGAAESSSEED